jgi:hypothetical protein
VLYNTDRVKQPSLIYHRQLQIINCTGQSRSLSASQEVPFVLKTQKSTEELRGNPMVLACDLLNHSVPYVPVLYNIYTDRLCGLVVTDPEVRVRFLALPDFLRSSESGKGSTQSREYN